MEARATLIKSNLRFVITIAKQYRSSGLLLEDLIEEDNLDEFKDFQGSFNLDDFPDSQTLNGKEFENSYFDGLDDPNNLDQTMKKDDGDFDDFDDSFDPEEFQKIEFDKEKK